MVMERVDMATVPDLVELSKTKLSARNGIKERPFYLTQELIVYTYLHVRVNLSRRQLQFVSAYFKWKCHRGEASLKVVWVWVLQQAIELGAWAI